MTSPVLQGELRFWPELAALLSDPRFWNPSRGRSRQPVLLIPGFLAGDASLTVMAGWLRRRGHRVRTSGIRLNVGCSGRDLDRLDTVLAAFGEPVVLIGQSRGGTLARALTARYPDITVDVGAANRYCDIIENGIGGHAELTPNHWDGSGPVDAIQLCRQVLDDSNR